MIANPLLTFGDIVLSALVIFMCLGGIWMTRYFDRQINALSRRIRALEENRNFILDVLYGFSGDNPAEVSLDVAQISLNGITYGRNGNGEWRRVNDE